MKEKQLPELLSPAGSEESLRAALAAGADAVYFGGTLFSNRMRAKNFEGPALTDAIRLTHQAGARAHITMNTRVRDRETDDALRMADCILGCADKEARADAIIIADLGLAAEILKRYPHAVLHASTQTSMGSLEDCRALYDLGLKRLVLPRELNREEIRALCAASPIEIEIFLHGALCVSCSGQCLLSSFCGGRSGNRGECAQPCRLPYEVKTAGAASQPKTDALSLADLCLAGRVPDLIGLGVCSLKIEGRLKAASYVYGVTSIYRRLLDEGRAADKSEIAALESLFTRGFTDGYYAGRYAKLAGRGAREDKKALAAFSPERIAKELAERKKQTAQRAKQAEEGAAKPISALLTLRCGEAARLAVRCGDVSVEIEGDIPSPATGKPLDEEAAAKSLLKCGSTGFSLRREDAVLRIDDGLWMPTSRLNDLRRRALEELALRLAGQHTGQNAGQNAGQLAGQSDLRGADPTKETNASAAVPKGPAGETDIIKDENDKPGGAPRGTRGETPWILECAEGVFDAVHSPEPKPGPGLEPEELGFLSAFARLDVPAADYKKAKAWLARLAAPALAPTPAIEIEIGAVLPVFPLGEDETDRLLGKLKREGCAFVLAHTPGQIRAARRHGMEAGISLRGNITNRAAVEVYEKLGCAEIGLSPELPTGAIRSLGGSCIVYGRIPVMTLARCVLKNSNPSCRGAGGRRAGLDPLDKPVCRGSLTDRLGEVFPVLGGADCVNTVYNAVPIWMGDRLGELRGASTLRFLWTTESAAEMADVIARYESGGTGVGRRIQ